MLSVYFLLDYLANPLNVQCHKEKGKEFKNKERSLDDILSNLSLLKTI